jgi:hypothetical protein
MIKRGHERPDPPIRNRSPELLVDRLGCCLRGKFRAALAVLWLVGRQDSVLHFWVLDYEAFVEETGVSGKHLAAGL